MSLRELPEITAFQNESSLSFHPLEEALEAFDAKAASSDENENTISIYGQIGIDPMTASDNTERRISAALRAIGSKDVSVNINSPGGNFFNGLAIYNALRLHRAKVTVNVLGMAGSAASIIAMAGDEIMMGEGASIFIHNASALVMGNKHDMQDATEVLSQIDQSMADVYAARTGVDRAQVINWMDSRRGDGTKFGVSEALKNGFADGKLDRKAVQRTVSAKTQVPIERVMENALISATNMSPQEAKAAVAGIKAGTRDAPVIAARDAGDLKAALSQLHLTLTS